MLELTIDGVVCQFHFGMGFMREINKKIGAPVDGLPEVKKNIGLQYMVAGLLDGDVEALVDILDIANKSQNPRVTRNKLDDYIDNEETDVEALFVEVLDFLKNANATKKTVTTLQEAIQKQKAKS